MVVGIADTRISLKELCEKVVHQSTAASTWWYGPRPRFGEVKMAIDPPRVPVTLGTPLTQTIFSFYCSLENR